MHTHPNNNNSDAALSITRPDILLNYTDVPGHNSKMDGERSPVLEGTTRPSASSPAKVLVPPSISSSMKRKNKPNLQLTIPDSLSNTSVATDVSSQGGRSVYGGEGQTQQNSNRKGTTTTSVVDQSSSLANGGGQTTQVQAIPNFIPYASRHEHSGSINLLRTHSAESNASAGPPLISPHPTIPHNHPVSYLVPQMSALSMLSPQIPVSPNVNGPQQLPFQPPGPSGGGGGTATLMRMNSAESTTSETVKIIDGELTRTDSLTSTMSYPPPLMRPAQPMTPSANAHHPYHRWTTVETPRVPNGHFVPNFNAPLISPTPRTTVHSAATTPSAHGNANMHFFGQGHQASPHLGSSMTNVSTTTAAAAAANGVPYYPHHGGSVVPPPRPPLPPPHGRPVSGFSSVPMHHHHPSFSSSSASASASRHTQIRAPHPNAFGTRSLFAGSGWPQVMSSVPVSAMSQHQQQCYPHPFGTRAPHLAQQQVHHGVMNHHAHHHDHRNLNSSDLYSMKDGSGMSSSVSVGSGSSQRTDGDRQEQFLQCKMRAKNFVQNMPVCRHWEKGTCWYGSTCKFRHPEQGQE